MTNDNKRQPDQADGQQRAKARQRAAMVIAGTGVYWILALWLGPKTGLDNRGLALLDVFALAGFGLGLWMAFRSGRPRT